MDAVNAKSNKRTGVRLRWSPAPGSPSERVLVGLQVLQKTATKMWRTLYSVGTSHQQHPCRSADIARGRCTKIDACERRAMGGWGAGSRATSKVWKKYQSHLALVLGGGAEVNKAVSKLGLRDACCVLQARLRSSVFTPSRRAMTIDGGEEKMNGP